MSASEVSIYVDLDGVLADFDNGTKRVTGRLPNQQDRRQMWRQLSRPELDFFARLAWTSDGQTLWSHLVPYRPTVLTGLPLGTWARPQKLRWCGRHLGADVPVICCKARDKHKWSGPGCVLIDDNKQLRNPWKAHGGTFILHRRASDTIAALTALVRGARQQPPH